MSAFRIKNIEKESEEVQIKRYLIKRGLEYSDPLILAILNIRLKYHKDDCHLVLKQLVDIISDNNPCTGDCLGKCDICRNIKRAKDLIKWDEVPKDL